MKFRETDHPQEVESLRRGRRQFLATCAATLVPAILAAESAPSGYTLTSFKHGHIELDVWNGGSARDPLVFILHDMVGLRQSCFDLGDIVMKEGFSVAIPRFFGGVGGGIAGYFKACELRSLFRCFDSGDYGPIMPWIQALAHNGSGSNDFGVIGNCMTGILPLLMLRSPRCVAPVLCQPAFPFNPVLRGNGYRSALGLPKIDQEFAALRTSRDKIPVLGIRYELDSLCRPERFCSLRRLLGDWFHCLELKGKGHSTLLGEHSSPVALKATVDFLKYRLKGGSWTPPAQPCPSQTC